MKSPSHVHLWQQSEVKSFVYYLGLAGFAALVDFTILYVFVEYLGLWYFFSAAISYLVGMIVNYSFNKILNFKNRSRRIARQFGLFAVVALIGLALNQLILYALVDGGELWYVPAKIIALGCVSIWSYLGHSRLTYRIYQ